MKFERVILIFAVLSATFLVAFFLKNSGFVIQNTASRVNIDSGIIVLRDEFDGSTTNFLYMNDSELGMIESMVLENSNHGKIIFNETINLTKEAIANIVDLDSNVNISFNRIEANTTNFTSLGKSATLYLYNLIFSNPRILKNGEICDQACHIISYSSGGTLIFNVSNFSYYSAEETPSAGVTPVAQGRSGGGGATPLNFTVDKDILKVSLKQGEVARETLKISNIGQTQLNFIITPELIGKFIAISEDSFSLKPGESKTLNVDFFAKEKEIPDAYIGRILVKSNGITKAINVIMEVKERESAFDISTEVLSKEVNAGGQAEARINIRNMGDLRNIDVSLYYAIMDFQQNILSFKEEQVFVGDELSLKRKLRTPANAPFGAYVFYSKVSYGNTSAASTDVFMITEKLEILNIILILLIILTIILIYLTGRKNEKR